MLAAGRAQFSANDLSGVWILQGNGLYPQIRAVAAIQQRTLNSIMTLEGSRITRPKDLAGATIGGTAGATPELLWPVYAKLVGLDPKAVRWVHMSAQLTPTALASGKVDGIGQFVVASGTVQKAAGGRKTRVLPYSDVIGDLYGNGLVTTTTMIRDNPDLVARFRAGLLEGLVWSIQHPQEAGQILHTMVPTQEAAAAAAELQAMYSYVTEAGQVGAIDRYGKDPIPVIGGGDLNGCASGPFLDAPGWPSVEPRLRAHKGVRSPDGTWTVDTEAVDHLIGRWVPSGERVEDGYRIDGKGFHTAAEAAWRAGLPAEQAFAPTVNPGTSPLLIDWLLVNDAMLPHLIPDSYHVHIPGGPPYPSDHRLVTATIDL